MHVLTTALSWACVRVALHACAHHGAPPSAPSPWQPRTPRGLGDAISPWTRAAGAPTQRPWTLSGLAWAPSRYRARRLPTPLATPAPPSVGTLSVPRETRCALACKCSSRRLRFSPQVPGETLASRAALSIHSAIGAALLSAASLRAGSDLAAALALDTALGLEGPQGRAPTTAPSWMTPRRPSRRPVRIESVLDQTVNT